MIGFRKRLTGDQRLVIACPSDEVRRLLALTGLDSSFDVFATVDDALHYLSETGGCGREFPLSPNAALILGLASTALPFADSLAAEARCWQRILLPEAGTPTSLQERLCSDAPPEDVPGARPAEAAEKGAGCHQRLERVLAHAARLALDRGASVIRTRDLLRGVVHIYGNHFEPGFDVAI